MKLKPLNFKHTKNLTYKQQNDNKGKFYSKPCASISTHVLHHTHTPNWEALEGIMITQQWIIDVCKVNMHTYLPVAFLVTEHWVEQMLSCGVVHGLWEPVGLCLVMMVCLLCELGLDVAVLLLFCCCSWGEK